MPLPESLCTLAELDIGDGVALTRLAKHLGLRVSVLMREYTLMGEAKLGGVAGPGWVRLSCDESNGRWSAQLTDLGRSHCKACTS